MHVLVLPSWYPTAEAPLNGLYFAEQARMLHQRGLDVGVVYPELQSLRHWSTSTVRRPLFRTRFRIEGGLPTLRWHGWNVLWRLPLRWTVRIRMAQRLARQYVRRRGVPDLIHAHSARWAGPAAQQIGNTLGVPYVITEHFSGFERSTLSTSMLQRARDSFHQAAHVGAVSASLRATLVKRDLVAPDRIAVTPNPVDEDVFTLPPHPRSRPPFRFAALAHLHRRKGMDVLLRAFDRAFRGEPEAELVIGGDGPARAALERLARSLPTAGRITFAGALGRDEVRALLWRAHAFVHPSRHETFGVVLVEAMATGLPVVATTCGGPEDFVTPEVGRLAPPDDPAALARNMRALYDTVDTYAPSTIRAQIVRRFGRDAFVRRTQTIYDCALHTAEPV